MITPRIFLIRHGATEWSQSGRYTGITDLPLLPVGEEKIKETAAVVVGEGRLIDLRRVALAITSPRQRATRTLDLLLQSEGLSMQTDSFPVKIMDEIREFGYGDYEGLLTKQIKQLRKDRSHERTDDWDVFQDGTEGEGGETPASVEARVHKIIDNEILPLHRAYFKAAKDGNVSSDGGRTDVIIVAHGHILRAFMRIWLGFSISTHIEFMLEPGGVCGLSYAHNNISERAMLAGMSFPSP